MVRILADIIGNKNGGAVTTLVQYAVSPTTFVGPAADTTTGYLLKRRIKEGKDAINMACYRNNNPVSGLFKLCLALSASLVLLSCTLEESTVISGRVTEVLASDTIRVGDKKLHLCGAMPMSKSSPGYYAAKAYLIDQVRYRKVRCLVVGNGTPCDGQARLHADGATVAQCFMYGRDLAKRLTGFTHVPETTRSLVQNFKTSSPSKDYMRTTDNPTGDRLDAIATHAW